jgi:hypothetical protein
MNAQDPEQAPPRLPSLGTMAANVVRETARHVAAGRPKASEELRETRLAICRECPAFRPADERCSVCGCAMKIKTAWQLTVCPKGKW